MLGPEVYTFHLHRAICSPRIASARGSTARFGCTSRDAVQKRKLSSRSLQVFLLGFRVSGSVKWVLRPGQKIVEGSVLSWHGCIVNDVGFPLNCGTS